METKPAPGTLEHLWSDPAHWRAGCLYYCKRDPRAIVPKRIRWAGWTINCARPSGWLALAVMLVVLLVPILLMAFAGWVNSWRWFAGVGLMVAVLCAVCWRLSSPSRFESSD